MGARAPPAALPGRAYPRSALTQSSFSARELQKERRKSLSARCSPACGQSWGPARPCPAGTATEAPALGGGTAGRGPKTDRKVRMQEPQGQRRTRQLPCLPSSSRASPASPFPLLSTCSWPRARRSRGRGALPRLQRGAAGSEREVAEPGGSPPASAGHGGSRGCTQQQGAGGLGLLPGCPCPGAGARPGEERQLGSYWGLAMTRASLKSRSSLFLVVRPWVTRTRCRSSGSADAGTG